MSNGNKLDYFADKIVYMARNNGADPRKMIALLALKVGRKMAAAEQADANELAHVDSDNAIINNPDVLGQLKLTDD